MRNMRLLEQHRDRRRPPRTTSQIAFFLAAVVVIILAIALAIFAALVALTLWLIGQRGAVS
jgi:hypothetical protein